MTSTLGNQKRREFIKPRKEDHRSDEAENKMEHQRKVNELERWFFEKVNEIDKLTGNREDRKSEHYEQAVTSLQSPQTLG